MSVSVIVPAHDAARTIEACVRSLLALDPPAVEVIVVDDASSDRTPDLAEAAGARVLRLQRNVGPGLARNAGARVATGDLLAFVDADCVARPDWLARLQGALDETCCAATGPYSGTTDDALLPQWMDLALRFSQRGLPDHLDSAISSNLLVRRSDFLAMGGFPDYRLPLAAKPYWGNEDQELAFLLVRHTGKPVRWVREGGPRHAYRSSLRGYLAQQAHYAEAVVVSHARFPELGRGRANYSKRGSLSRLISAWIAVPALFAPALPPLAACAVPFVLLHAPAVRFIAGAEPRPLRRRALAGASYPLMWLTSAAWTVGLISGALKGAAGMWSWRHAEVGA